MPSPTARSLGRLRRLGYLPAVVERWLPHVDRRADLWRFGDVLAVHQGRREFLIVQATSLTNVAARLTKARRQPELAVWLQAGGRFEVHGWARRNGSWHVRVVEVHGEDLADVNLVVPPRTRRRSRWRPADLF